MNRYIDAEKLTEAVNGRSTHWLNEWDTMGVLMVIEEQEPADVAPVVHAHWIELYDPISYVSIGYEYVPKTIINCSNCNNEVEVKTPYCPNCGAKMDGKEGKE